MEKAGIKELKKFKDLKDFKDLKEAKIVEIKVRPKIKDRFWKQKLSKAMENLFGNKVFYKPYHISRITRLESNNKAKSLKKEICIFLDLGSTTPFNKIELCLKEIRKNIEKEKIANLKIKCFYWNSEVKIINLDSVCKMKEKIESEYLEARESHLDDFILKANCNADLFIVITDKNNSSDLRLQGSNELFYKTNENKFIFCFVAQGLEGNKLEIDQKIEKNSIVVYD